jgi:glycerophosphoryl diester phosphodiesterase
MDVHPTRDGEIVVIHDATLDRTTSGSGPVAEHSLEEIREVDAGYHFTPDGGATYPYRGKGIRVPTLAEVLAAFPSARLNVEIKDGRAQEGVWRLVQEAGATQRVLIAAGRRANRSRFAHYSGPVSASEEELRAFYVRHRLHLSRLYHPPVDAFQMPERHGNLQVVSPRLVREAHAKNVAVHVWTVDAVEDMQRLLSWGVDGLVTDRPDRLARVLHERVGRPLPSGPQPGQAPPGVEQLLLA